MDMDKNTDTTHDRYNSLIEKLRQQGASLGTIDAFSAVVRELEDATVARIIRDETGNEQLASGIAELRTQRGVSVA